MLTVIPRILSMAQPMATSVPVTGLDLITSTESFLSDFRPNPQGTVSFPAVHALRINEKQALILPSQKRLLLAPDTVRELQATVNLMFLDAGRILAEKGDRPLKITLEDHPLTATPRRPWKLSASPLEDELDFEMPVSFEDGLPARAVPKWLELAELPSSLQSGEPLKRITVEIAGKDGRDGDDSIEVSESHRGAKRSVAVFHSETKGLQTFYGFRWKGAAVKELKGLLRLHDLSLPELGREIAAIIGASGLYEDSGRKYLIAGIDGGEFWIRPEQGDELSGFRVEGRAEDNDDTLVVNLHPSEKNSPGKPMPLPPSLFNLLWKGIFDFTD
jgi:hypothetical protein